MTPLRVRVNLGSEPAAGLPAMVGYSVAGHIVAFLVIVLAPRVMPQAPPPPLIITGQIVSLPPPAGKPAGAAVAPATAKATAPEPAEKAKEPAPPPKKAPEVVPPEPGKPKPEKKEETKKEELKPPRAGEEEPGKAPEKPAAPGPIPEGVGLATPGGEPGGIPSLNSAAFPYDWYRTTIVNLIRSRWRRPLTPGLTQPLRCSVSFVISKNGALSDAAIGTSSGFSTLDLSALRAVTESNPLPQLPYQYTAESIRAELVFELTPD